MALKSSPSRLTKKQQKELKWMLRMSLLGIVGFIFLAVIIFKFFTPQVGSLFGFLSIYRNQSEPQTKVNLTPPTFFDVPTATNSNTLNIKGYAPSGATVVLFVNGPEKARTLVGGDGQFLFENVALIDGRNTFFAKTTDETGNESEKSEVKTVVVDNKKPEITIDQPKDGDTIKNLDKRVLVTGSVSEKSKITVNDKLAVLKPDLSFEYLLGVSSGEVEIKVKAVDEAGNEKTESVKITYVEGSD
jgi:hypothetical protein